jgi:hypothetical protein
MFRNISKAAKIVSLCFYERAGRAGDGGGKQILMTGRECFGGERYNGTSMFDTIILLTGAVEQPVFASVLRGHNPRLAVLPVSTSDDLTAVEITVLRRARLIAFTTNVIVP